MSNFILVFVIILKVFVDNCENTLFNEQDGLKNFVANISEYQIDVENDLIEQYNSNDFDGTENIFVEKPSKKKNKTKGFIQETKNYSKKYSQKEVFNTTKVQKTKRGNSKKKSDQEDFNATKLFSHARKKRAIFDLNNYHFQYINMPSGRRFLSSAPESKNCDGGYSLTRGYLLQLRPGDQQWQYEYKNVKAETLEKIGDSLTILKIDKVLNSCSFRKYKAFRERLMNKTKDVNETMLFTSIYTPTKAAIYGFDAPKHIKDAPRYGFYFGKYINNFRCYQKKNSSLCKILLCRVILGRTYKAMASYKQFHHAPPGYNSLQTQVLGVEYYVIFHSHQIYPDYVITFKLKQKKSAKENVNTPTSTLILYNDKNNNSTSVTKPKSNSVSN